MNNQNFVVIKIETVRVRKARILPARMSRAQRWLRKQIPTKHKIQRTKKIQNRIEKNYFFVKNKNSI